MSATRRRDDRPHRNHRHLFPGGGRRSLCRFSVLLRHRDQLQNRNRSLPSDVLARKPEFQQLSRSLSDKQLPAEHLQFGPGGDGHCRAVAAAGLFGILRAGPHPVPRAQDLAAVDPERVDVSADRNSRGAFRIGFGAGSVQRLRRDDSQLPDLHLALHGLGSDHVHARSSG